MKKRADAVRVDLSDAIDVQVGDRAVTQGPQGLVSRPQTDDYPFVALPGKGASCPVVWKDRIFLTSPDSGADAVLAFDREGKQR